MAEKVHLLWFVPGSDQDDDKELLIGVYESESGAEAAIERLRSKPGFVDSPEGFQIHARALNEHSWSEGFVRD